MKHGVRHRPEQAAAQGTDAARAHDHQLAIEALGDLDQSMPGVADRDLGLEHDAGHAQQRLRRFERVRGSRSAW